MKPKFLLIAGKPVGSVDILNYAKERGYYTIVCDYLPKEQSPAKMLVDECWDYSTGDVDKIVEQAKKEGVSAVFTGVHEFNILRCQEVCQQLNLPFYATLHDIQTTSNKQIYKNIFKKFGIAVIPEYKVNPNNISAEIEYPILLKPVDGSGAYGLQICRSKDEVKEKMGQALSFSDKKEVFAERYIEDKEEITIVYMIRNSEPYLAAVADRLVKKFDDSVIPLPTGYEWPSKYLNLYEKTTDAKMKQAIKHMGLKNGQLFIQAIVKDDVIMPYDIGFRLSGTQEHIIFEAVCGYNPLKLNTEYALSGNFGDDELITKINPHFSCYAAQLTFLVEPSVIGKFEGLDEVEKMDGVIRVIKNKQEGDTVPQNAYGTLNQIALRVFIKENTKEKLTMLKQKIRGLVKIYSPEKKNICINGEPA